VLKGLSLLEADLTDQEFPPHVHDALVIAITEEGGAVVRTRGGSEAADPARVLVFNPGEPHSGDMGGSPHWRYRGLYFEQRALDRLRDDLHTAGHAYFRDTAMIDLQLARNLLDMHRALSSGDADFFHAEETIAQAMGLLYERHGDEGPDAPPEKRNRDIIDRAVEHLRARYDEAISLDDVSAAVGLTSFQLISLFKRELGLTPYALLTQLRLNAACSMLKRGAAIADCASACGFYDQAALTKHFRARFAITPAQFAAGVGRAV
jgi:AraC-like DNA-binding protein